MENIELSFESNSSNCDKEKLIKDVSMDMEKSVRDYIKIGILPQVGDIIGGYENKEQDSDYHSFTIVNRFLSGKTDNDWLEIVYYLD